MGVRGDCGGAEGAGSVSDPFRLHGPAYVSFSGGRTSAFMLWLIRNAGIAADVHVLFANTGKEREETLDFIRRIELAWDVPIRWLERGAGGGYVETSHSRAAREGEPFEQLVAERGFAPNPGAPYCSTELKARVMGDFMRSLGYADWDAAVGMRADEKLRGRRIRGQKLEGGRVLLPLFDAGIHGGDVDAFWASQPFDLELHPHEGNCDLCFKKAASKVAGIVDRYPERGEWWARVEQTTGTRFRNDRPSYSVMTDAARRQVRLCLVDDGGEPCGVCA